MFQLYDVPGDGYDCLLLICDFIVRFILLGGCIVFALLVIVDGDLLSKYQLCDVLGGVCNCPLSTFDFTVQFILLSGHIINLYLPGRFQVFHVHEDVCNCPL